MKSIVFTRPKKWLKLSFAVLMSVALGAPLHAQQKLDQNVYSFAIVPQQSASKMAEAWSPILQYLSEKSGYQLKFTTAPNIPVFEQRLAAQQFDFAYMNPYHFTVFNESAGYQALARARDKLIQGILVVRKESIIDHLQDLHGQDLAFPSPAAFAATVLPQAELKRQNIAFHPRYVSSHDSVYLNVASGRMLAGGGVIRTLSNMPAEIRLQLRVLWTSPGYTPHAFAVQSRVPAKVKQAVLQAMLQMHEDERGRKLLQSIKLSGLVAAQNSDWDDVRALNIQLLD